MNKPVKMGVGMKQCVDEIEQIFLEHQERISSAAKKLADILTKCPEAPGVEHISDSPRAMSVKVSSLIRAGGWSVNDQSSRAQAHLLADLARENPRSAVKLVRKIVEEGGKKRVSFRLDGVERNFMPHETLVEYLRSVAGPGNGKGHEIDEVGQQFIMGIMGTAQQDDERDLSR